MKHLLFIITSITAMLSCTNNNKLSYKNPDTRILFLHHSTGLNVWKGEMKGMAEVPKLLKQYNKENNKKYAIEEKSFPFSPYPWENYPYDYYNIWVKNAGSLTFMEQPTLELLTPDYDIIIFKFCFPSSSIPEDDSIPDINSSKKSIANYKLQMDACSVAILLLLWIIPASYSP